MAETVDIYLKTLHEYWGYKDFRGIQREIISSIFQGRDTLGLMPTGGGKSLTFQLPAILKEGVCIVITPLIALMKDQVAGLKKKGIPSAAIHSGVSYFDIITILENAIFGGIKILYVSPERLSSELFMTKLDHMEVSFITVDEAHCISQWGHDFRPSYLQINQIRKIKPSCPILALTATATPKVANDIQKSLAFKESNIHRMSFDRENLTYIVKRSLDKENDLLEILNDIPGVAIVYVRSRNHSRKIAALLNSNGISATFYNAGLNSQERDIRQKAWHEGKVRVMVATIAFGMGIDKPDVRAVIHLDCPNSLEAYFQEAGRAGRDNLPSKAILLYDKSDDIKLYNRIDQAYPEIDYIRKVYDHLAYYFEVGLGSGGGCQFDFDIEKFCQIFKHFPVQLNSALNILSRAGYISFKEEAENIARVKILESRDNLYNIDGLSYRDNLILTLLLRNYGGLFTEYGYVDESLIAREAKLSVDEVYKKLIDLSRRDIIHFIPKKKIPRITYERRREESKHLEFPNEVYKYRKEEFSRRINAVISYLHNDNFCRNRQLLEYFGEKMLTDCQRCDVCLRKNQQKDF